jgi:hypothetical protein
MNGVDILRKEEINNPDVVSKSLVRRPDALLPVQRLAVLLCKRNAARGAFALARCDS